MAKSFRSFQKNDTMSTISITSSFFPLFMPHEDLQPNTVNYLYFVPDSGYTLM